LRLPVAVASAPETDLKISPLQMVLAAAALSHDGVRPAPRLAMAVNTSSQGWIILPALSQPVTVFPASVVAATVQALMVSGQPFWQWNGQAVQGNKTFTWFLAGTLSEWQGPPLAIVVLLEETNPDQASFIGQTLIEAAIKP
jgi:hypothetical protein